ncbi:hypothetical protein [Streptomyces sp. NPDC001250]|uniref:hypothetical protein n=1 Tax=unclassified Streptomyces TaxID=2593676 RepID=UPI00331D8478
MPLPEPFDLDQLVRNMEQARGRRIVMKPLPDRIVGVTGICGLYVRHDTRPLDLIFYVNSGSPWHERQVKLHELVHLWAEDSTGVIGTDELLTNFSPERAEQLVAEGRAAARRRYETRVEQRAEDAAALINRMAQTQHAIDDPTTRSLAQDFTYGRPKT